MSRTHEYRIEHGSYYFYADGQMRFMTDEVAILFDRECGTLLKHGRPELVEAYRDQALQKVGAAVESGATDLAGADLLNSGWTLITGKFPVEELNRCLDTSGYVLRLYQQCLDAAAAPKALTQELGADADAPIAAGMTP